MWIASWFDSKRAFQEEIEEHVIDNCCRITIDSETLLRLFVKFDLEARYHESWPSCICIFWSVCCMSVEERLLKDCTEDQLEDKSMEELRVSYKLLLMWQYGYSPGIFAWSTFFIVNPRLYHAASPLQSNLNKNVLLYSIFWPQETLLLGRIATALCCITLRWTRKRCVFACVAHFVAWISGYLLSGFRQWANTISDLQCTEYRNFCKACELWCGDVCRVFAYVTASVL